MTVMLSGVIDNDCALFSVVIDDCVLLGVIDDRVMLGVFFQTMVLNPTLTEDMLLEMVQKVNNYSTRVRISTPLVSSFV